MSSALLCCPICCEEMEKDDTHLLRHFKYKKFACATITCGLKFYTAEERNKHCESKNHKRSFAVTLNPYLEMICNIVLKDSEMLEKLPIDKIVAVRVGSLEEANEILDSLVNEDDAVNGSNSTKKNTKKKVGDNTENIGKETPNSKKRKTQVEPVVESSVAEKRKRNTSKSTSDQTSDSTVTTSTGIGARRSRTINGEGPSSSTNDLRTPRRESEVCTSTVVKPSPEYNGGSADIIDPIRRIVAAGYYDPNDPDREDVTTVACGLCKKDVSYDYIIRKDHVGREHISADVSADDYDEMMKTNLDLAFPGLPNTDLACQLCMSCVDIRSNTRREHIEIRHYLPDLKCPISSCGIAYRRQCGLSTHLRDAHRTTLASIKDKEWQNSRRKRNLMISTMINKCFPMAQYATLIKTAQVVISQTKELAGKASEKRKDVSRSELDNAFENDVRVRDLNRTRRAPIYNAGSSSSSSESSDEEDSNNWSNTAKRNRSSRVSEQTSSADNDDGNEQLSEDDVIFLSERFNQEVSEKLKKRLANIKLEKPNPYPGEVENGKTVQPPSMSSQTLPNVSNVSNNKQKKDEEVKVENGTQNGHQEAPEQQITNSRVSNMFEMYHTPYRPHAMNYYGLQGEESNVYGYDAPPHGYNPNPQVNYSERRTGPKTVLLPDPYPLRRKPISRVARGRPRSTPSYPSRAKPNMSVNQLAKELRREKRQIRKAQRRAESQKTKPPPSTVASSRRPNRHVFYD